MGDAFYALDGAWRIVYANRLALNFWGVTADDVLGRVIWDRFPQLLGTLNEQALHQARADHRTITFEAPSPTTGVPVAVTVGPSGDGVCAYWRDISQRIETEQALRRSEEHLRLAQEAGGIGTWDWDLATDHVVWSARMFRLLGIDPANQGHLKDEVLARVHPDDRPTAEAALAEFRARPGPLRLEVRIVWPDGAVRWILFLGQVTADPAGRPIRMLGIGIDATTRRRSEDAIREDAERLRLAMKAGGLATWQFDLATQTRHWSPEAAEMHGFPPDKVEIAGEEWSGMIHPDDVSRVHAAFAKVLRGEGDYSVEYRIMRPDRAVRWTAVHGTLLRRPDGQAARVIGVLQDITERRRMDDKLRESEARLELATAAAGIGIWDWDLLDLSMRFSERAKLICGFPTGAPVSFVMARDLIHPGDVARLAPLAKRALDPAIRDTSVFEYRLLLPGGRIRWVTASGRAVFAEVDGTVRAVRFVGTMQDITDQKLAEQALVESEARLHVAMDAGRMAAWEQDFATGHLSGSPSLARILGFGDGPCPDIDAVRACYAPGELARVQAASDAALARGDRFLEIEFGYVWPDTSFHWLMIRAEFILEHGVPLRRLGVIADVTDRRRIEAALRENEARLRELLSTIDLAAVFVRALDGRIRFWSRGCERLYGWTAPEAVGRSSHELLDTVFPIPLSEVEAALFDHGEWRGDVRHRRQDGTVLTVSVHKVLRHDPDGEPGVVLESVADVTALRLVEAELRALNQGLEARVRDEVAAREVAQARAAHAERIQALGQLAGGIAHDFNNVLQSIQGGAALIGRRATDPEAVRRFSNMILDAATRGASITRRLLAFARHGDLRAEPVALAALLDGLREVLTPALGAAVQLRVEVPVDLPPVLADRGQLETALVNLAVNARDAMRQGGTLLISAMAEQIDGRLGAPNRADLPPGRFIRLEVRDSGEGMDQATLARVLEPFFTTKPAGQGTGLGLPMVKGFAEQSGGAIAIESRPGCGTTVLLWLPQADGAAVTETTPAAMDRSGTGSAARVLLVDDEPLVREVLAEHLEELGYEVIAAASGEEALRLLGTQARTDALVTDLSMPGMDGLALIRAVQAQRPGLPAVLLTGYAGDGAALAMTGAIAGSFTLLRKPVSGEQLADRVAALLETRRGLD